MWQLNRHLGPSDEMFLLKKQTSKPLPDQTTERSFHELSRTQGPQEERCCWVSTELHSGMQTQGKGWALVQKDGLAGEQLLLWTAGTFLVAFVEELATQLAAGKGFETWCCASRRFSFNFCESGSYHRSLPLGKSDSLAARVRELGLRIYTFL